MGNIKIECVDSGGKSLNKLPNHLLVDIGSRLHHQSDLRALMMTNKRFHAMFEEMLYKKDMSDPGCAKSLSWAVTRNNLVIANKIINFGGNLDAPSAKLSGSNEKVTALVLSITCGSRDIATMLVVAGANVDKAPDASKIPIFLALEKNWLNVLEFMVSVGKANLGVINEEGYGLLTVAAHLNDLKIVRYLLSVASRLGLKRPEKSTAFHGAILRNNFAMLSLLLENPHTSPNIPCEHGKTPLQLACEKGKIDFVRALLGDARVTPLLSDTTSNDCLALKALRAQRFDLVMLLLTHKNFCRPSAMVFTEACKLKRELIAWRALELLNPTEHQANEWKNCAQKHGLCDLVSIITETFEL